MIIQVTEHAIKRYRERFFDYSSPKAVIKDKLIEVARKGKKICIKPGDSVCAEVLHKGTYIVIACEEDNITIITCLGDLKYRKWVKHQDNYDRLGGRILYPPQAV